MENRKPKLFYGWFIVLAAFGIMAVFGGTAYSFGVFFQPLLNEFGWTRAMTSGAFSLYMALHGCLYIVTGRLTDRFGPRLVMTICGLFMGLGYLLMSQVETIWQLYLFYGVIIGIGTSGGFVPLISTVARWFTKRRGMITGIVGSSIGLGIMIMPPLAGWLISTYGWRFSYIVMGIIVLVVTVTAAQFLKRDPGEMGLVPYGADKANADDLNSAEGGFSFGEAIHTRQFWVLCVALLGFGFCLQTIMVHVVSYAMGLGISAPSAVSILAAIGATTIIGKPVMGTAGDRIGNKPAIMIGLVLMSAALLWLLPSREMWMFYLFAAFFGFAYGGISAMMSPVVADLFGLRSHGVIFGVVAFSTTMGGAIGPFVAGYIFDVTSSYNLAIIICIVVSFVAWMVTLLLRPTNGRGGINDQGRST